MHPILTRPERLALYLGAWVVVGILIAGVLNRQGLTFAEALVLVLPLFLAYSFVCLSAWYVCRAVPLRSSGVLQVLRRVHHVLGGGERNLARARATHGSRCSTPCRHWRTWPLATVSRFRCSLPQRC